MAQIARNKAYPLIKKFTTLIGNEVLAGSINQGVVLDKVVISKGKPISTFTTRELQGGAVKGVLNTVSAKSTQAFNQGVTDSINQILPDIQQAVFTWVTMGDDAVRETHEAADRQTKYARSPVGYLVGGYDCERPRDDSLPDEEKYGCRCWEDMEMVDPAAIGEELKKLYNL